MAVSNHERVRKALELLNQGLLPFIEREMKSVHGDNWTDIVQQTFQDPRRVSKPTRDGVNWDTSALISIVLDNWQNVFSKVLGSAERSLIGELRNTRNKWAHQEAFSTDDTYRAIDSCGRLLIAVSAAEQAAELERQKQELLRIRFEEQTKKQVQIAADAAIKGESKTGLKPWREIISPHPDVASGKYQQAEFAADLNQVYKGEGTDEYRDPKEFFSRTYFTEGLKQLLASALQRLDGTGGDPIIELHTNFGGGKTHSMLALYHLFAKANGTTLPGIDEVIAAAGGAKPVAAKRAVLVGTALAPGQVKTKADGTVVRTIWGELAWQLLGTKGYSLVAESDQLGVSPGSDVLAELFKKAAPCIVLIDEWVAFMRMLHVDGLPAGSFDANLSFAQSLTEAIRTVPRALLVASIPASDIEVGGEFGREALVRLRNIFSRMESAWRPASAEEGFEIVRRRLFQPISTSLYSSRDAVIKAFMEKYRENKAEFPGECSEADYERRMKAAYPIHPELFDRLFNDWSALDRFQRTRGVLRLMAGVINSLWEQNDSGLLIMPCSVPIHSSGVQAELTRYLEDNWIPVIEKDVDGANSVPMEIDRGNPNFGRYSACRRVARTLYLGSAPTLHTANKGLDDKKIKLGCFQPGETVATFGDALRQLADSAMHLYVDGSRYWFSTQPSVMRLAVDRAGLQDDYSVHEEIKRRLRTDSKRGDFVAVQVAPNVNDVPDESGVRLIFLDPENPHAMKDDESPAIKWCIEVLERRGGSARFNRNCLIFLAPDRTRLSELEAAVKKFLAWKSIYDERETLNLDVFQTKQANTQIKHFDDSVNLRIQETYFWVLVPVEDKETSEISWEPLRMQGGTESLSVRASKKLRDQDLLYTSFAGTLLRSEMDKIPLWRGNHVSVKQLAEDLSKYLYLPRLKDVDVLLSSIADGVAQTTWTLETFAYADRFDESTGRYIGLRAAERIMPTSNSESLVVKPDIALKQIQEDRAKVEAATGIKSSASSVTTSTSKGTTAVLETGDSGSSSMGVAAPTVPKRFYAAVMVDATRLHRDTGKISDEVIQHLAGLVGANVEVTLEIRAEVPQGIPDYVVRTVTENCKTLRFRIHEFESE